MIMKKTIDIFHDMFPSCYEMTKSYSIMDKHTIKCTYFNGQKVVFRYMKSNDWFLMSWNAYKD